MYKSFNGKTSRMYHRNMYVHLHGNVDGSQTDKNKQFRPGGLPDRCLHVVDTCVRVVTFTNTTD